MCSLWQSIQVLRNQVNRYSLTEVSGVSVLDIDLIKPILLENLRGQRLEIRFKADLHGELSRVICRVFKRPSVPVPFMRTYHKKTPKKKLRVLPLSSPSSEEDSVVKSPERSRAKILFDQIQHSTPIYKCGVRWEEQTHGCSSTIVVLGGSVRKRPFPDSGYLSDHTRTSPKRVSPTETVRSPKPRDAKEKRVDVRVGLGEVSEPSAEEDGPELEKAQSRAKGTEALSEKVGSVSEGAGTVAEEERSVVDVTQSLAEEARPVREEVEFLADGARATTESHDDDKESVTEEEPVEGVESVIELEPAKFKLELSAEGASHFPDPVDLQVTNSAESLVSEQSEELRANTDIASLKSLFEQQLTSQWQQVEKQLVQFQSETCTHMSGLLSAFQQHRVVHSQMLQDTVWNWKALEDFHTISSGIMSFMKAENQRVMSFCQQQILRLKSSEMEGASEKRGSSPVQK
ncbi:hypothetical protein NQD34_000702 [Periophthalmus magnuspinnatus]|nr:hypothetical protein NQD34_000702 [Periophthalmus magnuspinnatus]